MKRITLLMVLIVMTLLVFSPVTAQEETEEPPTPVVQAEPVETVPNPLDIVIGILNAVIAFITGTGLIFLTRLTDILKQLKEALDLFNVQAANARK